jgi:NAD(P)-dependent dehydrogenase (short-subunit alcohol dehydrogenase family)
MGALDGKVAVVAGASRGIGKGVALELGAAGAMVYASGRTLDPRPGEVVGSLKETAATIEAAGGHAVAVRCDHTDDTAIAALIARVRSEQGRLDVVVNSAFNASEFGLTIGVPFWELPTDIWRDVVDVGTKSAYLTSAHAAPLLIETGPGLIVNVSGRAAERYRYGVAYGVGKAALDKMTRDMAEELRRHGVAVVSVWPNVTRTENLEARGGPRPQSGADTDDIDQLETPRFSGRAVVALAVDQDRMARTGQRFWVAQLAMDYDFTDEHGRGHPLPV